MNEQMNTALAKFKIRGQVSTAIIVQNIGNHMKYAEEEHIIATIPHVSAGYRCVEETKSGLMPGTRVELTQELETWATTGFPTGDAKPIYYLSGAAGLGKSAFAYHLCRLMDEEWGLNLGASFFFYRGSGHLESARSFFPTIAHSFAMSQPALRSSIVHAARTYLVDGEEQQMREAFHRLLRRPLVESPSDPIYQPTTFLIIDGLDECKDRDLVPDLLESIFDLVRHLPWLRVFIAARPEINIRPILISSNAADIVHHRSLNDTIDDWDEDIAFYLRSTVPKIGQYGDYIRRYPMDLEALIDRAEGVFIYAQIAVNFLQAYDDRPEEQFALLLEPTGGVGVSSLDNLYLHILRSAFPPQDLQHSHARRERLRDLLAFLALRQANLSPGSIALLLAIPEDIVLWMVNRLSSVLLLDAYGSVVPLHATFVEFLLDRNRCIDTLYHIDPAQGHAQLASKCLSVLTFAFATEILRHGHADITRSNVAAAIGYSTSWMYHVHNAGRQDVLTERIQSWIHTRLAARVRIFARVTSTEAKVIQHYFQV
ncbi:AAA-16 domain-containing protein [Phanerochaete sordida]|uniref:AAA-16 domain-containing protein n=1 Tax=Phanerochaete sordida TaxID=48140 RepID=A0A9P3LHC1_9APHY|nr:AAA-16 domain-containing protein [Phanerochaete sordida]